MFLPQPVQEVMPVPDFRTLAGRPVKRPSPNLLDTIYLCQQRQEWYREHARMSGQAQLDFIGSATLKDKIESVADAMRERLHFSVAERKNIPSWSEALRLFMTNAEAAGVLVMASGVVGSNSHRKLDVEEFRGFALSDPLAPLVFINAADSKAAQMFTLAHELAHLWLGESGVSDIEVGHMPEQAIERWCNAVAAEFLMPVRLTRAAYQKNLSIPDEIQLLAREFKVSTLVVLRRLFDAGFISETVMWQNYHDELKRIRGLKSDSVSGGDFYRTLGVRTGKRFAQAVLASTLEGQTLFRDAFRLLGFKKDATFYKAARELGVMP
jgi:Zn-dependent peptidase ImmA (M78 family)